MKRLHIAVIATAVIASAVGLISMLHSGGSDADWWRAELAKPVPKPKMPDDVPSWVLPEWERINELGRGEWFGPAEKTVLFEIIRRGFEVKRDHRPGDPMTEDDYRVWLGERASGVIEARLFMGAPVDDARVVAREYGRLLVEGLTHPRVEQRKNSVVSLVESKVGLIPEFRDALANAALDPEPEVRSLARLKISQLNMFLESARARGQIPAGKDVQPIKVLRPPP